MTATRKVWTFDPHTGGIKIPPAVRERIAARIIRHAEENYKGRLARLDVRFRGALCYIDAYREPDEPAEALLRITGQTREEYREREGSIPIHLCRLRYFGDDDRWSLAFYTYSNERYEPCFFPSGDFFGTAEEGFDVGSLYLQP